MAARKGLGELLVRENLISIDQLEQARKEQKKHGGRLSTSLVQLGYVKEKDLAAFMGQQYNLPTIDIDNFEIDTDVINLVPAHVCKKNTVIPVQRSGRSLVVAFADPSNIFVKDDLSLLTRLKIEVVVASETSIKNAINRYYGSTTATVDDIMSDFVGSEEADASGPSVSAQAELIDDQTGDNSPIVSFVNAMLAEAIKMRASDIHIEPYEKRFRIRYRIDGVLTERTQPPPGIANAISSRIKILSKMDIAERRRPQDGRLKVRLKNGQDVDFRVNSLPVLFGEKIVLRILDKSNLQVDLTKLGFEQEQLKVFQSALKMPQGLLLITGPTGSGKTTTIYSGLAELNKPEKNIQTAEDPVEFNLDGINQVQVNADIGFGFPEALRAFLRQDPEVIMVGEIRDLETALIAFKAASTGHLVVSTLHTNDSTSTVTRLIDMGVPNYMVAEATKVVIAQRLIKKICGYCIVDHSVTPEVLLDMGVPESELDEYNDLKRGEGCPNCNGTGLAGRMAIFEVLKVTTPVKEGIFKGLSPLELKRHAVAHDNMVTLRGSALLKLKAGMTSVEEVLNVTVGDEK